MSPAVLDQPQEAIEDLGRTANAGSLPGQGCISSATAISLSWSTVIKYIFEHRQIVDDNLLTQS
eukprot:6191230-Pleurochrysis_carterae.AAC.1